MIRSVLTVVLLAGLAGFASTAFAKGDPVAGKLKIYTCHGCHGITGYVNTYPTYHVPRIGGQNEQYIIDALHEYKNGQRKHPTMDAQGGSLTDQDIEDIAAYLSRLPAKSSHDN